MITKRSLCNGVDDHEVTVQENREKREELSEATTAKADMCGSLE